MVSILSEETESLASSSDSRDLFCHPRLRMCAVSGARLSPARVGCGGNAVTAPSLQCCGVGPRSRVPARCFCWQVPLGGLMTGGPAPLPCLLFHTKSCWGLEEEEQASGRSRCPQHPGVSPVPEGPELLVCSWAGLVQERCVSLWESLSQVTLQSIHPATWASETPLAHFADQKVEPQ